MAIRSDGSAKTTYAVADRKRVANRKRDERLGVSLS
jgi:hypothetical protein